MPYYSNQNHKTYMGGIGTTEILLIFGVVLIFFGAKKLPELARGMGKAIREFKDATKEVQNEIERGSENLKDTKNN